MRPAIVAALAAVVALLLVLSGVFFTVSQTQQAIVLMLGEPKKIITKPGLQAKVPFLETVLYFDNRILDLETPQQEVIASDNQRILVDAFVRYHIVDPLKFYQTVGTIQRSNNQLASLLNSALRRVLGEVTLPQIVKEERGALMVKIRDQVNKEAAASTAGGDASRGTTNLGLVIDDVRIRRADLPRELSEKVFSRMNSERAREAASYRAAGAEQAQRIRAEADRQAVVLKADADRQSEQIRGAGDAERNRIFAEAYQKDPAFFSFYRSMQAYAASFKSGDTRLVLSPDSNFFRFFDSPSGAAVAAGGGTVPAAVPTPTEPAPSPSSPVSAAPVTVPAAAAPAASGAGAGG